MHIGRRAALAAALLVPLCAMTAPHSSQPHLRSASADGVGEAATRFKVRIDALNQNGSPVGALKAPADRALLNQAFDVMAIRALPIDMVTVYRACQPVSEAYGALIMFITKPRSGRDTSSQFLEMQDEVVIGTVGADLCIKRMLIAAAPFVTALSDEERAQPTRRNGVKMMQIGGQQVVTGILMIQSDPGISAANRARLIAGLLEDINVIADAMAPKERARLRTEILGYADRADAVTKPQLLQAARAFEGSDCGILCAFAEG